MSKKINTKEKVSLCSSKSGFLTSNSSRLLAQGSQSTQQLHQVQTPSGGRAENQQKLAAIMLPHSKFLATAHSTQNFFLAGKQHKQGAQKLNAKVVEFSVKQACMASTTKQASSIVDKNPTKSKALTSRTGMQKQQSQTKSFAPGRTVAIHKQQLMAHTPQNAKNRNQMSASALGQTERVTSLCNAGSCEDQIARIVSPDIKSKLSGGSKYYSVIKQSQSGKASKLMQRKNAQAPQGTSAKKRPVSDTSNYNQIGKGAIPVKQQILSTFSSIPSSLDARDPSRHSGIRLDLPHLQGVDVASEVSKAQSDKKRASVNGLQHGDQIWAAPRSRTSSPALMTQAEIELLKLYDFIANHSNDNGNMDVALLEDVKKDENFVTLRALIERRKERARKLHSGAQTAKP